jgi:shikimate dehydrogenase
MTGARLRAGVIGWPVAHSRSPALHGFWLRRYRIDGSYERFAVPPPELGRFVRGLPAGGYRGANVTLPHKEEALALMDRLEPSARRVGAVNTIVVAGDGALVGSNTDGFGFVESLREGAPEFTLDAGPAVVLGAGGAARAIVAALVDGGAPELRLVNRSRERAEALAEAIGGPIRIFSWAERAQALDGAALLVNTTSLGMQGQSPLELDLARLPPEAVVNDIVYTPLETALLAAARRRGNRVVDGLGMLLHQARPGFAAWFGVEPEVTPELRRAVLAAA